MLFNSFQFLIFFPIVVCLYFAIPHRARWILLLAASYYFYMCWKPEYIILIIVSTLIAYYTGIQMGNTKVRSERKKFLILSLVANLAILFGFKYLNFFGESVRAVFNLLNIFYNLPTFNVLLPIGISFYTFQTLSYSIDLYRGHREPEKHLGIFALYVAYFPQLVSGPIERSTRLLPQFYEKYDFDYQRVTDGLKLMAWGLFKKLVIADKVGILVNQVYNNPRDYSGIPLIIATYFFAFQIYCDFSGYTDIARGGAQVMGYRLMENFKRPYFSQSVSEFWKRWHISLSSWFKDYLYIPLGGNRVLKWRWYFNLIVVFLVSGLWHGANWTFVLWGALHGFYLLLSIWTKGMREKVSSLFYLTRFPTIHKCLKIIITFHLVVFAWIFFRGNSIYDSFYIVTHLFTNFDIDFSPVISALGPIGSISVIIFIISMQYIHLTQERHKRLRIWLTEKPLHFRWACYYAILFLIIIFGEFGENQFIYFQF